MALPENVHGLEPRYRALVEVIMPASGSQWRSGLGISTRGTESRVSLDWLPNPEGYIAGRERYWGPLDREWLEIFRSQARYHTTVHKIRAGEIILSPEQQKEWSAELQRLTALSDELYRQARGITREEHVAELIEEQTWWTRQTPETLEAEGLDELAQRRRDEIAERVRAAIAQMRAYAAGARETARNEERRIEDWIRSNFYWNEQDIATERQYVQDWRAYADYVDELGDRLAAGEWDFSVPGQEDAFWALMPRDPVRGQLFGMPEPVYTGPIDEEPSAWNPDPGPDPAPTTEPGPGPGSTPDPGTGPGTAPQTGGTPSRRVPWALVAAAVAVFVVLR